MRKLTFYAFVLFGALAFASCGKDGAVGPAGETGPAGAAGPQGAKGDTGTANVIYSEWLNLEFQGEQLSTGDSIWFTGLEVPQMTTEFLQSGTVMVYVNFGTADDPAVLALPYYSVYNNVSIIPVLLNGVLEIDASVDMTTGADADGNIFYQYRYVLIPGGKAARSSVDWKDYSKVKAYLNLKD